MEKLPNELIVKIFNNLDQKSLANASKTCKGWLNLITNNQSLLNNFHLILLAGKGKVKCNTGLIENYKSAKIFINNKELQHSRKIESSLARFKDSLKSLEIRGEIKKYEIFYSFITPVLNITHLTITNIIPEDCDEEIFPESYDFKPIFIPTLKFLQIDNSLNILPLLQVSNLETFKVYEERRYLPILYISTSNFQNEMDRIEDGFFEFIKTYTSNLKVLHLDGIRWPKVYQHHYDFKLEEVSLQSDCVDEKLMIEFLSHHKSTLKHAAIFADKTNKICEFLLKEFNLNYLDIELSTAVKDLKVECKNFSIKQLELPVLPVVPHFECSLGPRIRNTIGAAGIEMVKACCNVEMLGFYDYNVDLLKPISEMKKLKKLKIYFPPAKLPSESFEISNVEILEVDWIPRENPYIEQLLKFLPLLVSLKVLKIKKFDNASKEIVNKLILLLPHLIELHLGSTIEFSKEIMLTLNEARKKGYALKRLSFLANGNRFKEFASFRVDEFYFRAYEKESGFFNLNRFHDCDNRRFEKGFEAKKEELEKVNWDGRKNVVI